MQRGQDQVPGLCGVQREAHGLRIPELADHEHVRVLAQRIVETLLEARSVAAHLPLANERLPRNQRVLDGRLQRDDVPPFARVDLLDQRRQRARFPGSGRAADDDEAIRGLRKAQEIGVQVELRQRRLERGEKADGETYAARSAEHVDAEARARDRARKIARAPLQKLRPALLADQLARHREQLGGGDRLTNAPELPAHAQGGGQARFEMEIAGLRRAACGDEGGESHAGRLTASNSRRHVRSGSRRASRDRMM